jgi:molybdenum cofactor biosynthesis enzyme MoaA
MWRCVRKTPLFVLREPARRVGTHLHLLEVHELGDDGAATERRLAGIVAYRALDAGVDEEQTARRVMNGVKLDDDRLVGVLQSRGLRLRIIEVDQSGARHGPVGADDRLDRDRTRLIDERVHRVRRRRRSERSRLRVVRRGAKADGRAGGDGGGEEPEDGKCDVRAFHGLKVHHANAYVN